MKANVFIGMSIFIVLALAMQAYSFDVTGFVKNSTGALQDVNVTVYNMTGCPGACVNDQIVATNLSSSGGDFNASFATPAGVGGIYRITFWDTTNGHQNASNYPSVLMYATGKYNINITLIPNLGFPGVGSISGTITGPTPLTGTLVSVTNGTATFSAITDVTGAYTISGIVPATYDITASRGTYNPATQLGLVFNSGVNPAWNRLLTSAAGIDADGDGFISTGDCDDANAAINILLVLPVATVGCGSCIQTTCTNGVPLCTQTDASAASCGSAPSTRSSSSSHPSFFIPAPEDNNTYEYVVDLQKSNTTTRSFIKKEVIFITFAGDQSILKIKEIGERYTVFTLIGKYVNETFALDVGKKISFDVTGDFKNDIEIKLEAVDTTPKDDVVKLTIQTYGYKAESQNIVEAISSVVNDVTETISGMVDVVEESFKERPNMMIGGAISVLVLILGLILYLVFFKPW